MNKKDLIKKLLKGYQNQLELIDELKKPYLDSIKDLKKLKNNEISIDSFIKSENYRRKYKQI